METFDIAVVGFGAAGSKAALDAVFGNFKTAVFAGSKREVKRSRGTWVYELQNVPGLRKSSLPEIAKSVRETLLSEPYRRRVHFVDRSVVAVAAAKTNEPRFLLIDETGEKYAAHFVILAVGDTDRQPEIGGIIRSIFPYTRVVGGRPPSIHYCLRCDGHLVGGKDWALIGHGRSIPAIAKLLALRAIEYEGSLLGERTVVRRPRGHVLLHGEEPAFGEEDAAELTALGIDVFPQKIEAIDGDPKKAELRGFRLEGGILVPTSIAFVGLGMWGRNVLYPSLRELGVQFDGDGFIVADGINETSVENVFAIGDNVADRPRQVYSHWTDAYHAVREIEHRTLGERLAALKKEVACETA